jgi:hypothetical protein
MGCTAKGKEKIMDPISRPEKEKESKPSPIA